MKYSTQFYSKLFLRALSHEDFRMRLAAVIAIGETAIDNLTFQMKVIQYSFHAKKHTRFVQLNEMNIIPKLFEMMKNSIQHVGFTMKDINEHSKLVAWICYTIVNICANCIPNILLLKGRKRKNGYRSCPAVDCWNRSCSTRT